MSIKMYILNSSHGRPRDPPLRHPALNSVVSKVVRSLFKARFAPAQWLLFALLAFQLAFGLPQSAGTPHPDTDGGHYAPTAHNATQPSDSTAGSMTAANDDGACPLHAPAPDNKHDCCKSSACQCQCGSVSLAVNLHGPKGIAASTQVQPITAVRFATAPADTLFRPPIRA